MNRLAPRILSFCFVLLLGCAAENAQSRYPTGTAALMLTPEQQIALAAGKNVPIDTVQICEYERVTGSNIPEWRCRYLEQRERESYAAQKYLLQSQSMGGTKRPGLGN